MSKQAEAELILKLYDFRREAKMREARDWFFREFNPETIDDYNKSMIGPHSGLARMVLTYWEMAASLVKHEAISQEFFSDANGEHFIAFAKVELLLPAIRATYGAQVLSSLEWLIDATPGGRQRAAETRERMKRMREAMAHSAST